MTGLGRTTGQSVAPSGNERPALDDEGWTLDEHGNQWGYCNGCGEESQAGRDCCADGEVVPYDA